jgi:DNA-3-methyladenine glycosylase II
MDDLLNRVDASHTESPNGTQPHARTDLATSAQRLIDVSAATAEIARRDPVMARLIEQVGPFDPRPPLEDDFSALVRSIMYQQLAGRAAAAIHARFLALFDGGVTPAAVDAMPIEKLRSAGLSGSKAASVRDLAAKVLDGTVPLGDEDGMSDDEIVARLSSVRGIGRWTAEMFLIFQLRRLDVWPVDDYGVRKGYAHAYGLAELPTPKALMQLGECFRPYRTIAAWYCWRTVDIVLPAAGVT